MLCVSRFEVRGVFYKFKFRFFQFDTYYVEPGTIMSGKKKGLSVDEKKKVLLAIYHEKYGVYLSFLFMI